MNDRQFDNLLQDVRAVALPQMRRRCWGSSVALVDSLANLAQAQRDRIKTLEASLHGTMALVPHGEPSPEPSPGEQGEKVVSP